MKKIVFVITFTLVISSSIAQQAIELKKPVEDASVFAFPLYSASPDAIAIAAKISALGALTVAGPTTVIYTVLADLLKTFALNAVNEFKEVQRVSSFMGAYSGDVQNFDRQFQSRYSALTNTVQSRMASSNVDNLIAANNDTYNQVNNNVTNFIRQNNQVNQNMTALVNAYIGFKKTSLDKFNNIVQMTSDSQTNLLTNTDALESSLKTTLANTKTVWNGYMTRITSFLSDCAVIFADYANKVNDFYGKVTSYRTSELVEMVNNVNTLKTDFETSADTSTTEITTTMATFKTTVQAQNDLMVAAFAGLSFKNPGDTLATMTAAGKLLWHKINQIVAYYRYINQVCSRYDSLFGYFNDKSTADMNNALAMQYLTTSQIESLFDASTAGFRYTRAISQIVKASPVNWGVYNVIFAPNNFQKTAALPNAMASVIGSEIYKVFVHTVPTTIYKAGMKIKQVNCASNLEKSEALMVFDWKENTTPSASFQIFIAFNNPRFAFNKAECQLIYDDSTTVIGTPFPDIAASNGAYDSIPATTLTA